MNKLKTAIKTLKSGGVIIFPTETVFGIGACLDKPRAINRIFKIKKRPKNKPLQILVANLKQAQELGKFCKKTLAFAIKNWPGPYTLIVPAQKGKKTIGLRIPDHQTILRLIRKVGPIAATSTNLSGLPPALTTKQAREYVGDKVDFVMPGRTRQGKASKVIDFTKENQTTLRP
ncbi:threonylcarbamoyl-AMP synthase [Candidatus Saganbacteria bacterium CG08_land_8_20_14_0_20_45_16]|uniref:L-threonylcarbamoyladenylate synthase n=1 Tax=Candidatus Saganbacteria bacterium CG08_land_8_20_14_0_20_45_16 TaxID=2014293 RepID=A0A2H0Y1H4_UNCSA|nr:MAG: threonylcarbamoyl-AMP synthase [Candidatus Saganbacteria bacterium CG08_land_8_20_14_0_20_45_16]